MDNSLKRNEAKMSKLLILILLIISTTGCSRNNRAEQLAREQEYVRLMTAKGGDQGVQTYTWEEPMVDVIEVPAGLDPRGVYYRPQHQQVIEIRQGRWRYSD